MKDKVIQAVRGAFKEYILVKGYAGLKPGRAMEEVMWKEFLKGLEWRVDKAIEK